MNHHSWKFARVGGFDQVRLDSGADLLALDQLDQKLWVALACPTRGLELDSRTLDLIDTDRDGRIRAPEILAATRWACQRLKTPDTLLHGAGGLPLAAVNDATPEGQQLLSSARRILANLGKPDAPTITVEDASDTARIFAGTKFNGDGVVTAEATDNAEVKAVMADIIACLGAVTDLSGQPGVNQAKVEQFYGELHAYQEWQTQAEANSAVLPLGPATAAAVAAYKAVAAKVDDYFARTRLAAFDDRALAALNREEKEYLSLTTKDLSASAQEIAGFPLARIAPGRTLPLRQGINPAWEAPMASFTSAVVQPLLGERAVLTEADWQTIKGQLAPYENWQAARAGVAVEKLGLPRIRQILSGDTKPQLAALIAQDKALEPEVATIAALEKLARLHRDLFKLLNNFVCFRDFYGRKDRAIFQAGTLFLDQRSCDLCLPVEDAGRHATMAGLAGTYLAYCDCTRKATGEKMQIVAAFTDGDSDHLMVGRNGVFYDRKGRDWDATITRIVDNPISLRQAFWAPYKKFVRLIEEQIAKRAAAAEAASSAKLETTAAKVAEADKTVKDAKPEPKKVDVGTVAALGVAFGAIGGFLTALWGHLVGVFALGVWAIIAAVLGLMLLISGPSLLIAWLKLRKRNLGPVLDANGWAINARARINVPFGASLTHVAALPAGARRDLVDPFEERKSPWPKIIVAILLLWIAYSLLDRRGLIYRWTGGWLGKPTAQHVQSGSPANPSAPFEAPTPR